MKKIILLAVLFCTIKVQAQDRLDDIGRITIHAYIPESEELPYEAHKLLTTKLSQIITANGIADNEDCVRFVLTAKVNIISKDIVPGPPQRISQKIDVTLLLGDIEDNKAYSQATISIMGVGLNDEKSFISAIKSINPKSPIITAFLQEGKERIIGYYQTHGKDLLAEAKRQASMQNYEDALMLLASIPDVCTDCFEEASKIAEPIFVNMIEARGKEYLQQAQTVWAQNPTRDGAAEATRLLSQINFAASCMPQANDLITKITAKMNEIDRREWEHEMKVYQDGIEREKRQWTQQVREYEDQVQTQRMYLKAARDVAITYAKNQPKVVTRIVNYNRIILW